MQHTEILRDLPFFHPKGYVRQMQWARKCGVVFVVCSFFLFRLHIFPFFHTVNKTRVGS